MKITMIGTGYVGLVTGTCFAEFGHHVTCVDKVTEKIEKLKEGTIPIYEPGLDTLVAKNIKDGHLSFTTELADAVAGAEAVFHLLDEIGVPDVVDGFSLCVHEVADP